LTMFHVKQQTNTIQCSSGRVLWMAYLQEMGIQCNNGGCISRAVVRLVNWTDDIVGEYCLKCGKRELKKREGEILLHPEYRACKTGRIVRTRKK